MGLSSSGLQATELSAAALMLNVSVRNKIGKKQVENKYIRHLMEATFHVLFMFNTVFVALAASDVVVKLNTLFLPSVLFFSLSLCLGGFVAYYQDTHSRKNRHKAFVEKKYRMTVAENNDTNNKDIRKADVYDPFCSPVDGESSEKYKELEK